MKNTKSAGLVSCDFEAYIIDKINNDLEREKAKKKHKKFESEVLKEKKLMDKLMTK